MRFPNDLSSAYKELISIIFPNKCVSCGEIIDENEYLCDICYKHIERIDHTKQCKVCGMEKKNCRCSYRVYRFVGIASVFYNTDIAKRAYYAYKIGHKMQYGDFFAEQMALSVKKSFYGISFDYICAVPSSLSSRIKRGFDHCGLLCDRMSQILGIRKLSDVLASKRFIKSQHTSSFTERAENVNGKYHFKRKIGGGRVLLVDDIITTGATLDECARQLLLAGADEVYCVTALYTLPKNVEKKKDM